MAQDDARVAWYAGTGDSRCRGAVSLHERGRLRRIGCGWVPRAEFPVKLALTGSRAIWTLSAAGNITEEYVYTATPTAPRARLVEGVFHETGSPGGYLTALAGDRPSAAWGVVRTSYGGTGIVDGAVRRVGGKQLPIAAAKLDVDGGLVATAAATRIEGRGRPVADAGAEVAVRRLDTGERLVAFTSPGVVRALALDWPAVVALVSVGGERRLLSFDGASGRTLLVPVASNASSLSADSRAAVYRTGRVIRVLDIREGTARLVARAASTPVGLSVDRGRVVWGENVGGRGRIRALQLVR